MANGGEPGDLFGRVVSPENLALLRKGDRFVVLAAGLIVVAALGGVAALRDNETVAMVLALASMGIVAGLVALVQWRAHSFRDLESGLEEQHYAAAAVNGDWWQITVDMDHPGLTYVSIRLGTLAEGHAMHGITFTDDGRRVARWSTDAVAVRSSNPVELYYVWRGSAYLPDGAQFVSGIGRFRFDSVGRERRPLEGEGSYTRGSEIEMQFGTPRGIELMRLSDDHSRRLAADPSCLPELAKETYITLNLAPGRVLERP